MREAYNRVGQICDCKRKLNLTQQLKHTCFELGKNSGRRKEGGVRIRSSGLYVPVIPLNIDTFIIFCGRCIIILELKLGDALNSPYGGSQRYTND